MSKPLINCSYGALEKTDSLKPHPRNPNTHTERQIELLAKIIKHQGWRNCIVVSKRSGLIVAGHGRLLAAKKLGLKEVPVDWQQFKNVKDELSYLVADNRIAEIAEINRATLAEIIGDIDSGDFDLELTGFELSNIEELMTASPPLDLGENNNDENQRCPKCGEAL